MRTCTVRAVETWPVRRPCGMHGGDEPDSLGRALPSPGARRAGSAEQRLPQERRRRQAALRQHRRRPDGGAGAAGRRAELHAGATAWRWSSPRRRRPHVGELRTGAGCPLRDKYGKAAATAAGTRWRPRGFVARGPLPRWTRRAPRASGAPRLDRACPTLRPHAPEVCVVYSRVPTPRSSSGRAGPDALATDRQRG